MDQAQHESAHTENPGAPPVDGTAALRLLLINRGMLLGYINAITGDPTLSEDVFQEVSIVVLDKHAMLTSSEGFKPWARTIARFQALKAVARRRSGPVMLSGDIMDLLDTSWSALDEDSAALADQERLAALRSCLTRITPRARRLVEMRYFENLPGARIAELLGKPLNTIYVAISRIHRALGECVRGELQRQGGGRGE
jgi:RNA polymerase sigma-70 factor (ECF subfamily)